MTHQTPETCWCPHCVAHTPHRRKAQFSSMGELRTVDDECLRCGEKNRSHEEPLADPPPLTWLTWPEQCRWRWVRGLYRAGGFTDELATLD